ncbi:phosphatidylglycerophosphatase B [Deinococcus piscis]|uniref:Phosphatidylglycerophosphatase B n=1 Tax=Deinococcus piscis TaxID=394230 RepID=A0ABQ3JYP2_9DEIO|nr:phosphatase PAP2 family protein [Deinococcus piscis]GHF94147.1 phosphatidylglycerophosphatase B [Deinococcus piscis]
MSRVPGPPTPLSAPLPSEAALPPSDTRPASPHRWLGLVLGVLLPLLLVGWLGEEVLEGERFRFEAPLMLAVHEAVGTRLDPLALWLHFWGGPLVMPLLFLVLAAWSWRYLGRRAALFTLLGPGSAVAVGGLMKLVFSRPRPELWPRLVEETSASFPSGHATMGAALATWAVLLLWPRLGQTRWLVLLAGLLYAGMMGFSRIVLGVHYPSDVLAGWLTGLALVLGMFRLLGRPLWPSAAASVPD